jgi:phosphatidylglycerophosphate synthase
VLTWDQYAHQWAALHGGVDPRRARTEVRRWLRVGYEVARMLVRLRVPPVAVTAAGLVFGLLTPALAALGGAWSGLAAVLVLASALADTVDGAVALLASRTSRLGYLYDAVADRLVELCWLAALWLLGVPGWLAACCLGLAWLHEYVRARASGAGMPGVGVLTLAEGPTRAIFAAAGLGFAGLGRLADPTMATGLATMFTVLWAGLGVLGLGQLLRAVVRVLHATPGPAPALAPAPVRPLGVDKPPVAPAYDSLDDEQTLSLLLDPRE